MPAANSVCRRHSETGYRACGEIAGRPVDRIPVRFERHPLWTGPRRAPRDIRDVQVFRGHGKDPDSPQAWGAGAPGCGLQPVLNSFRGQSGSGSSRCCKGGLHITPSLRELGKNCRDPSGQRYRSSRLAYCCGVDPVCTAAWHCRSVRSSFTNRCHQLHQVEARSKLAFSTLDELNRVDSVLA